MYRFANVPVCGFDRINGNDRADNWRIAALQPLRVKRLQTLSPAQSVYCTMRLSLIFSLLVLFSARLSAQKDYFYAQTLIGHGQHAEAVRVLDHLTDSGAYAERPRFAMMTLNLAGSTKLYLQDTAGAVHCFESVLRCYDTLSGPNQREYGNQREYYIAGQSLADVHYHRHEYTHALELLQRIGEPGPYYSSTGLDVLNAGIVYQSLFVRTFERLDRPDSAFAHIRKMRGSNETRPQNVLDSIFRVETNVIHYVQSVPYTMMNMDAAEKKPGYLYFVQWNDKDNAPHSIWFTNPAQGPLNILGTSGFSQHFVQDFPASCCVMRLSPDEKFLAVESFADGRGWVDIFSFPEIITEQRCVVKRSIAPYSGKVNIVAWEHSLLYVQSDTDLLRPNKNPANTPVHANKRLEFLCDPENGKFSRR